MNEVKITAEDFDLPENEARLQVRLAKCDALDLSLDIEYFSELITEKLGAK